MTGTEGRLEVRRRRFGVFGDDELPGLSLADESFCPLVVFLEQHPFSHSPHSDMGGGPQQRGRAVSHRSEIAPGRNGIEYWA